MIISLITIMSTSIILVVGGGTLGYFYGNRRRIDREILEDFRYYVN